MRNNNDNIINQTIEAEREGLFRLACYRTGNADDAADILQEVLMKVWSGRTSRSIDNIRNYLYRGLLNACTSYHRQKAASTAKIYLSDAAQNASLAVSNYTADDTDTAADDFDTEYRRITRLLRLIPTEQAEVIQLRTLGGKSFGEIAEILEMPVPSVKSRFRYGIEKIRKMIDKQ